MINLGKREREVLLELIAGGTVAETALRLGICKRTVKATRQNIYLKFGLTSDTWEHKAIKLVNLFGHFELTWVPNELHKELIGGATAIPGNHTGASHTQCIDQCRAVNESRDRIQRVSSRDSRRTIHSSR